MRREPSRYRATDGCPLCFGHDGTGRVSSGFTSPYRSARRCGPAAIIARLGEAEEKQQALKFDASDLFNMEAKIFGAGRPRVAAEPNRGTPSHDILGLLGFLFGASEASAATTAGPQVIGMWRTLPYLMPINPIHMSMLHTGNILVTAGSENTPSEEGISSKAALWSLQSGTFTVWNNLPWDIFCNGQAALPDGRILIFGGTEQYKGTEGAGANFYGDARATIFDPATTSFPFSQVQSMADGRWYGTATVLGNGGIMAFSGDNDEGDVNNTVEIYRVYQTHQGWSTSSHRPFFAAPLSSAISAAQRQGILGSSRVEWNSGRQRPA